MVAALESSPPTFKSIKYLINGHSVPDHFKILSSCVRVGFVEKSIRQNFNGSLRVFLVIINTWETNLPPYLLGNIKNGFSFRFKFNSQFPYFAPELLFFFQVFIQKSINRKLCHNFPLDL